MRKSHPGWTRWLAVSLAIVVFDFATKAWVSSVFAYGESKFITPFLNLVLVHNTGAAFSFLANAGGWQRWFFIAITFAVSAMLLAMLRTGAGNRLLATALALLLGGAAGNLWDRVTLGHVVDFVQVHAGGWYFPAFNVADSAITVGVILLIADSFRGERQPADAGAPAREKP